MCVSILHSHIREEVISGLNFELTLPDPPYLLLSAFVSSQLINIKINISVRYRIPPISY